MLPETELVTLPPLPAAPPRPPFPYIAAIAPVIIAVVLWFVTSSPFVLMFAFLGPVLAVASTIDARRVARRTRHAALDDTVRHLDELGERLQRRGERWCDDVAARVPTLSAACMSDAPVPPGTWRLGVGSLPSSVEFSGGLDDDPRYQEAVARVRESAAMIADAPIVVTAAELHLAGPATLTHALARALILYAALSVPPPGSRIVVPASETWADALPHRVEHGDAWEVTGDAGVVIRLHTRAAGAAHARIAVHFSPTGDEPQVRTPADVSAFHPGVVSRHEARIRARQIAERARRTGWDDDALLPDRVMLEQLWGRPGEGAGELAVALGMLADRPVIVDLEADGPHALVAGTTGSGKSELLISWVLALAHRTPPERLAFLLIDFKGGSAFAGLRMLPHVVGVVSDLEPSTARRAVDSLRAELRRREHLLAAYGVRDVTELPPGVMPRLVVVVDEFAALLALDAELGAVFSDLAARGRSLGLHLILCTQRPSGIVREGVLANITLRICLRVLEAGDSDAVVGTRAAAELSAAARGRAIVREQGVARLAQLALAAPDAAERIAERWSGHTAPDARPWLDPLPPQLAHDTLIDAHDSAGLLVGRIDLPAEQAQPQLSLEPWADGAVLVVGASGTGRTSALRMLAHAARVRDSTVRWVPDDPAELWQALTLPPESSRVLVVADDLDRTLSLLDVEPRTELSELIRRTTRDARRTGVTLVASARSTGGTLHGVSAAFDQRLLLRLPSREDHLLAGGELSDFRADRRPGAVIWRGAEAQLAWPPDTAPELWKAALPDVDLALGEWAVAAVRPSLVLERLRASGVDVGELGSGASVIVADVDGWLSDFTALTAARRTGRMVFIGCAPSDHRTLTRQRTPLPPLSGGDEVWVTEGADTCRARLNLPHIEGTSTG